MGQRRSFPVTGISAASCTTVTSQAPYGLPGCTPGCNLEEHALPAVTSEPGHGQLPSGLQVTGRLVRLFDHMNQGVLSIDALIMMPLA